MRKFRIQDSLATLSTCPLENENDHYQTQCHSLQLQPWGKTKPWGLGRTWWSIIFSSSNTIAYPICAAKSLSIEIPLVVFKYSEEQNRDWPHIALGKLKWLDMKSSSVFWAIFPISWINPPDSWPLPAVGWAHTTPEARRGWAALLAACHFELVSSSCFLGSLQDCWCFSCLFLSSGVSLFFDVKICFRNFPDKPRYWGCDQCSLTIKINPAMLLYCLEAEERTVGSTHSWGSRHFILKCPKLPEATAHRRPMR